ncbi:MAG: GAF domain-containing protein [Burkholderiales bacterium]|nr:GAF domain-containing protein [Burkholderiales bacterium]
MHSSPHLGPADLLAGIPSALRRPGAVQAQGLLLALQDPALHVVQASANWAAVLQRPLAEWLGRPVGEALGPGIEQPVRLHLASALAGESTLLRCRLVVAGAELALEGHVHRNADGLLLLELEPACPPAAPAALTQRLGQAIQALSEAADLAAVGRALAQQLRSLLGYDHVMVCRFEDEHGSSLLAEAGAPMPPAGHTAFHAATEIPPAMRALYLRSPLRLLVDSESPPSPLMPARADAPALDLSGCSLCSLPASHLQRLRQRGVRAALGLSLVRDGRLWGLVVCHHAGPCRPPPTLRAAAALLAEAASTRIAALENHARARAVLQVQQLARRLIEATAAEGDWRAALVRDTQALLQPLAADAALLFQGELALASGGTPVSPELRALGRWVRSQPFAGGLFQASAETTEVAGAAEAAPEALPTGAGLLALALPSAGGDLLVWLRQAPGPGRRAAPWTDADLALARCYAAALADILAQVDAVRWLIAERQAAQAREAVRASPEPMVVGDASGRCFRANMAFRRLVGDWPEADTGTDGGRGCELSVLAQRFAEPTRLLHLIGQLRAERRPWRGELALRRGGPLLRVRAEPVPAADGGLLGLVFLFDDLTASRDADQARRRLESVLAQAGQPLRGRGAGRRAGADEDLMAAILANASMAAMDIADHEPAPPAAAQLQALEGSARRATRLYDQLRDFIEGSSAA